MVVVPTRLMIFSGPFVITRTVVAWVKNVNIAVVSFCVAPLKIGLRPLIFVIYPYCCALTPELVNWPTNSSTGRSSLIGTRTDWSCAAIAPQVSAAIASANSCRFARIEISLFSWELISRFVQRFGCTLRQQSGQGRQGEDGMKFV